MTGAIPQKCPACSQDMRINVLRCPACDTEVRGDFRLGRFEQLSGEQLTFLETFIRCRGSLKDLGAEIGISYPTARNRLDTLIEALGFEDEDMAKARRMEALNKLKEGLLTADEALNLLQGGTDNE